MSSAQTARVGGVDVPRVPTRLFIGGRWHEAQDGATMDIVAPASEEPLASLSAAGPRDIDAAVCAARASSRAASGRA